MAQGAAKPDDPGSILGPTWKDKSGLSCSLAATPVMWDVCSMYAHTRAHIDNK